MISLTVARRFLLVTVLSGILLPAGRATGARAPAARPGQMDLAAAATAERDGDYATAEAGYRSLTAATDRIAAATAGLALGRLLVERLDRYADGLPLLQAARAVLGTTSDGLRAGFLIAEAQAGLKQNRAAAASYQSYLDDGGPAAGYAALQRAAVLSADGEDGAALAALTGPLKSASPIVRTAALQAASRSHVNLGDRAQAAAEQRMLAGIAPRGNDRVIALLEAALLDRLAGNDGGAAATLQEIVQQYPDFTAAGQALDQLDALAVAIDPLQRAVILFNAGRGDEARALFRELLDPEATGPVAAELNFYLGRIADHEDENDRALADYADAYTLDPTGSYAGDALWRKAELLRALARYGEAEGAYAALAQQFPGHASAAEAAFDAGFMAYLDGRPADAATVWDTIARATDGAAAARASLWLGKLAQARGDAGNGAAALSRAQALQPAGYHGLRAEAAAGARTGVLPGAPVTRPATDWSAVEGWLIARFGPEDPAQFSAMQAGQAWREGIELDALGWAVTPNALLHGALDGAAKQPWALYRAARTLTERGITHLAEAAAEQLLRLSGVQLDRGLDAPASLLRLAYPLDYVDLVNRDAAQLGLDPLLIEAIVRQESGFYPSAGSSAGAQGLLQLEPATAAGEAQALGLMGFTAADLRRPLVNLRLGAAFLADQAQAHDMDLSETLAAYNAGGRNAYRWARQAGGDPDRFYESVDFSETRLYIRVISENYATYNALYRGTSHPTLLPH